MALSTLHFTQFSERVASGDIPPHSFIDQFLTIWVMATQEKHFHGKIGGVFATQLIDSGLCFVF